MVPDPNLDRSEKAPVVQSKPLLNHTVINLSGIIAKIARANGYTEADVAAGLEHFLRSKRMKHPPGSVDKAGRFTPFEQSTAVTQVRAPSRRFPYPEMRAARTAKHCADVYGADELAVKRYARALKICLDLPSSTALEKAALVGAASKVLKSVARKSSRSQSPHKHLHATTLASQRLVCAYTLNGLH